jgi:DNA-binding NarL/FixJ family response regulator
MTQGERRRTDTLHPERSGDHEVIGGRAMDGEARPASLAGPLTAHEFRVLLLLARDFTVEQITGALDATPSAVEALATSGTSRLGARHWREIAGAIQAMANAGRRGLPEQG